MNNRSLKLIPLALVALAFLLLPLCLFAQDATPSATPTPALSPSNGPGITADAIVQWLTPILVPLLLAGFKRVQPSIPSWVIPMLAPVLGVVIDLVNSLITSHASNLWVAAGLGLAGVGLREMKEAVKPAPNGGWPQKFPPLN